MTRNDSHEARCGSRPRLRRTTAAFVLAGAATFAIACGESRSDEPAAEPPQPEGVHGVAPAAVGGTPSVVTLRGVSAVEAETAEEEGSGTGDAPRMDQLGLVFTPLTLLARVGETVVFTNSETLVHNVHVRFTDTDSTVMDVDTDPGARVEFAFEREGGYDVTCEHHPGMRAFIYVTRAPYAAFADARGSFVIPGVQPGTYTLSVWSVDPELRSEQTIDVVGRSTEVAVERP